MALLKPKYCSCYVLSINYILCNKFVLSNKFVYILLVTGNITVKSHLQSVLYCTIQGINFSQTQQFITQNILMATCFDSIESSLGLPKNRSNVSKFYGAFWYPKRLQWVVQLIE